MLRFTQAAMELIDKQTYLSWKLPKGWTIILTSNPDNGNYFVTSLDNAQKTRFISIDIKFDVDCWAEWAEKEKIDG
jgi:MoxR-like ATPase